MKVTIVSSDVSSNCLGRALVLADILTRDHDVRVVGTRFGSEMWAPAREQETEIAVVPGARWPDYRRSAAELVRMIDGDVVIAVKPHVSSFGVALWARWKNGVPVVLDIDDAETALKRIPWRHPRGMLKTAADPNGALARPVMLRLSGRADAITVASSSLRTRFGGEVVWHAKDLDKLRADPDGRESYRREWEIDAEQSVVLFLGTPRPWKGVEDAVRAVQGLSQPATMVVVGADDTAYSRALTHESGVRTIGMVPFGDLPGLLSAADVVVVPQRDHPVTRAQMPSKLFDAMAVGRPIVATAVSDIPLVLGEGRGRVVPPGDVPALRAAIESMLDDPQAARQMGERARQWCEAHASTQAARRPLENAIERAMRSRGTHRVADAAH